MVNTSSSNQLSLALNQALCSLAYDLSHKKTIASQELPQLHTIEEIKRRQRLAEEDFTKIKKILIPGQKTKIAFCLPPHHEGSVPTYDLHEANYSSALLLLLYFFRTSDLIKSQDKVIIITGINKSFFSSVADEIPAVQLALLNFCEAYGLQCKRMENPGRFVVTGHNNKHFNQWLLPAILNERITYRPTKWERSQFRTERQNLALKISAIARASRKPLNILEDNDANHWQDLTPDLLPSCMKVERSARDAVSHSMNQLNTNGVHKLNQTIKQLKRKTANKPKENLTTKTWSDFIRTCMNYLQLTEVRDILWAIKWASIIGVIVLAYVFTKLSQALHCREVLKPFARNAWLNEPDNHLIKQSLCDAVTYHQKQTGWQLPVDLHIQIVLAQEEDPRKAEMMITSMKSHMSLYFEPGPDRPIFQINNYPKKVGQRRFHRIAITSQISSIIHFNQILEKQKYCGKFHSHVPQLAWLDHSCRLIPLSSIKATLIQESTRMHAVFEKYPDGREILSRNNEVFSPHSINSLSYGKLIHFLLVHQEELIKHITKYKFPPKMREAANFRKTFALRQEAITLPNPDPVNLPPSNTFQSSLSKTPDNT